MRPLTPESVQQLYATLMQCYDMDLIEHWEGTRESTMGLLTLYLNAMHVPNVPEFLQHHHIDIDGSLYIPCAPGSTDRPLIDQVMTCAGALQRALHLGGCVENGTLKYLLLPIERVSAELEAVRAEVEVRVCLRDLDEKAITVDLAERFANYGCTDLACKMAYVGARLDTMMRGVAEGRVTTRAARDVLLFYGWNEKA